MKITILNLHSSRNLGDAAITYEMVSQLQKNFPNATIHLVLNDPSSHPQSQTVKTVGSFKTWLLKMDQNRRELWQPWTTPIQLAIALAALITYRLRLKPLFLTTEPDKRALLQTFFSTDIFVGCGGQVLATKRWFAFSFYWITFAMLYACWLGKPVYLFPQTVGPLAARHHRWIINYILNKSRLIMVRDGGMSLRLVESLAHSEKIFVLPDAAFGLPGHSSADGWKVLGRFGLNSVKDVPTIGMTVMNWSGLNINFSEAEQTQYESAVARLIEYIVNELKGRVFIFGQVIGPSLNEDDRVMARKIVEKAQVQPEKACLIDDLTDIDDLVAAYACLDLLVGTRMHSTIMALISGVPVCAIGYQVEKTRGTLRWVGLENFVCDIRAVTPDSLINLFEQAWQARSETRAHLTQILPTLAREAQRPGKLIAEDWARLQQQRNTA